MRLPGKITLRVLGIMLFLLILGKVYTKCWYQHDLQEYSSLILEQKKNAAISNILYYGESSNFSFRSNDAEKKRISEFTSEYYPGIILSEVDTYAIHAGNYRVLLQNIEGSSPVETIIITLNLRSFNAGWIYSDLETALQKSMVLIDPRFPPFINRIRLSFKDYEIKSDAERQQQVLNAWNKHKLKFPFNFPYDNVIDWDRGMAKGIWKKDSTELSEEEIDLGCHYIKTYAFQIDTLTNPRIKDFDDIVEIAKKYGWNLVFNLMAENVERAQELVGDELTWLIRQNRDLLVNRYQKKGVIVVDNLEDVPDEEYIDRNWTTEHYAEKGRKIIARNLADSLRKFYPNAYVDQQLADTLAE